MIIHSPIISGSLTFADGATFTFPDGGVYSGSFSGSISGIGDPESFSASLQDEISQLKVDTGSQDARLDLLEIYTSSQDTKNSTLGTYSSSIDTKNSTLGTYTGSVDTKFSTLGNLTGSYATTGSNLFIGNQNISGSISLQDSSTSFQIQGNGFSQTYLTSNGAIVLNPGYGGVEMVGSNRTFKATDITAEGFVSGEIRANNGVVSGSSQIVGILSPLNTFSASEESKNSTLATTTGSLLSSQTNLNTYTGSLLGAFQVTGSKINFLGDVVIYGTQSVINSQNVQIADNILYLSPTSSVDNDLGVVGHYNDGTYRHAGIFMDASDGHSWKVFNGLTTETSATIDTAGTGFTLADFKAGAFTGTSFTGTINSSNGVVSGSSQISLGSASGNIALATQTTGDYVASLVASTGVTITNNSGENATPSIAIGQSVATSANAQFNSLGIGMAASATAGRIDATNDIVAYSSSDIRFKENITPIENPLEKISQIGGYTYDWKEETKIEHGYEGNDVGVIAQEIEAVLPQLVQTRDNGYKAVKYDKLVALLIAGMKEQQSQIEELRNKINELESGL